MYPCSTTISRELQPTTASHSPFSPPLDSQLKHLTGYVRALTGSMEPTGCAGTILKTTFPLTEYDLMSKFSRSILPSGGGGSCLCWFCLSQTISMAGGQRWSKSRLEGRLGSRTSVPTTASSQGAISKCSYCFDIKIYNQNLQATQLPQLQFFIRNSVLLCLC